MTGQEQTQEPLSLSDLLKKLIELGGSDLHLTTNTPPQVRVDGHLRPVEGVRTLTSADTKALSYSVLTDAQKHRFEENLELDFSFGVRGLSRFRANLVNQREVGADTRGFAEALRTALRQDPDVVLVGEMRDLETIESALRIAETGHLTFATLHTNSAATTINRIIDVFPSAQQSQIRAQLSMVFEGILCQTLLPRVDGRGRCMALEILVPNPAIRNLIREDKVHQIYSMMQTGQGKHGMQTLNQALATLYHKRIISIEVAMQRSSNADELRELIEHGAGVNTGNGAPGQQQRTHPSPYAQSRPVGTRPGGR